MRAPSSLGAATWSGIYRIRWSSTKTVFDTLTDWFVPGTVLVFDEYFGYYGWQHHEHKSFMELLDRTGLSFEGIGIGHMNIAVRLTDG